MFKLVHLSDPHLGPLPRMRLGEVTFKRLTGYLNWHLKRRTQISANVLDVLIKDIHAQQADHIALTGDLVNLSLDQEICRAAAWLHHLGSPNQVTLVPGNHDAYVPGALDKTLSAWADYYKGDDDDTCPLDAATTFPTLRQIGSVAIIGLSSAVATPPFNATGKLGRPQIEVLATKLAGAKAAELFRVVLIHHPPYKIAPPKSLLDHYGLGEAIAEQGAELILHGHTHTADRATMAGPDADVPVIGVPAAAHHAGSENKNAARYNLFEIGKQEKTWICTWTERGLANDQKSDGLAIETIRRSQLIPVAQPPIELDSVSA